ncbi:inositol monophosphatase [Candidatus Peregrinibacteria bacterium]|nr:inositol monophosphatase [Candidatus Peregrinibacteria bacterium]
MTDTAIAIAKKAGRRILKLQSRTLDIDLKGKSDLVTNADKESENLIIKEIKNAYPDHGILAEEASVGKSIKEQRNFGNNEYIWIIDPIDGTTNYAHNQSQYCVSIAVFRTESKSRSKNYKYITGEMVAGVIYAPKLKELFYAEKNNGAYLNHKRIHVSDIKRLSNSLLVTGFPPTHKEINLPYFATMINKCQAVRRFGSAALDLAYIAAGRFDGFWEFGLKPWDIAAGALIVKEAGGKISDTNGNLLDLFGRDILATNGFVHNQMKKVLTSI